MILCIFNPEHDLCLGNGDENFIPPASALQFAAESSSLMRHFYGPTSSCTTAERLLPTDFDEFSHLALWGIDARTVKRLHLMGVPERLLPGSDVVDNVRLLQNRSSSLSLQQGVDRLWNDSMPVAACSLEEVVQVLCREHDIVLKAPWSGAGRGLRWVSGHLSDHDRNWALKVISHQGGVMVEPRRKVLKDYALEYWLSPEGPPFLGYSLFTTQNGVYRDNLLLDDAQIRQQLVDSSSEQRIAVVEQMVDSWLTDNVVNHYCGPLGVDLYIDDKGLPHVSEINFRHTMGMLAVARRQQSLANDTYQGLLTPYLTLNNSISAIK